MVSKSPLFFALILCTALIVTVLEGCVQTTVSGPPPEDRAGRKFPDLPPNRVVDDYLLALKNYKFKSAYRHISTSLDPESYDYNMRRELVERLNWSLLSYDVMGVRILGDKAYVIAQVAVSYNPRPSEEEPRLRNFRMQYTLDNTGRQWVITDHICIENCEELPAIEIEEVRPLELDPVEEPQR